MKNLFLILTFVFFSSLSFGNTANCDSSYLEECSEEICMEETVGSPCGNVAVAVGELVEFLTGDDELSGEITISVYNACCELFPSAC